MSFLTVIVLLTTTAAKSWKDPHRPPCREARCKNIKSYLKSHYCGASPFGNGPDDGCDIRAAKRLNSGVEVLADFQCRWNESKLSTECQQTSPPSTSARTILMTELHRLGLPTTDENVVFFRVWKPTSAGWSVGEADFDRVSGVDYYRCSAIVLVDADSHAVVLRASRFQKTNADVPSGTTWSLLDIADVDADGQPDIILEGDEYENHWLEVASKKDGSWKTIFSGLGYYL